MSKLDEILEPMANSAKDWVIDQLEGTSYFNEALDGLAKEKHYTKQQIKSLMLELVGENHEQKLPGGDDEARCRFYRDGGYNHAKDIIRQKIEAL